MGSCSVMGSYFCTDWRSGVGVHFRKNRETGKRELSYIDVEYSGINGIIKHCDEQYGDDPYNGTENTVSFYYKGDYRRAYKEYNKKGKSDYDFIENRLDDLGKRDGEVIMIGDAGFLICTTDIVEVSYLDFDSRVYLKGAKGPAVLVAPYYDSYKVIATGTVADMKKEAHKYLRNNNYNTEVYIIGRSKSFVAKAKAKFQEKTTRHSDDKNLVLPVHEYLYYGWAAE